MRRPARSGPASRTQDGCETRDQVCINPFALVANSCNLLSLLVEHLADRCVDVHSIPLPIALDRFKQLPQRSNEIWQGGLVKLPAWVDNPVDPDGPPYRPTGALWVSLRTGVPHLAFPEEGEVANADLALKALIEFGLKEAKKVARVDRQSFRFEMRDSPKRCL